MLKKDKEVEELKTRTLGLNPSIEDCREVGSRGTNCSSHVLDGTDYKFETEGHRRSIQDQVSCRASVRINTFEEAGEPVNYDGQCRAEISQVFTSHSSGVPLAGLVQYHLRDSLINGGTQHTQDSTAVISSRVAEANEKEMIKAGTVESAVKQAVHYSVSWRNDCIRKVNSLQECTITPVEGQLLLCSVSSEGREANRKPLITEIQPPDAKTPEVCPNSASVFRQGVLSTSTHAYPGTSMRPGRNSPDVSRALLAHRRMLCASDVVLINSRDAYLWTKLEASHVFIAKQMRSVLRFVWDAIT